MLDDGIVQFGGAFILVTSARAENMRFAQSHFAKSPTIETDAYFSYCIPLQENYTPQYQANVNSEYVSCWLHTIINRKASFSNSFHGLGESSFDLILMNFSNASIAGPFMISSFPDCSLLFLMPSRCNWLS